MPRLGSRVRGLAGTVAMAWAGATLACGGHDSATQPGSSAAGAFTLTLVNSKPLPYLLYADTGYTLQVSAGTLDLQTSGKFAATLTSLETVAGHLSTYVDSTAGTWTQSSTIVLFTNSADGSTQRAAWDGSYLIIPVIDGADTTVFTYARKP